MPVHIFGNVADVPRLRAALPERVAIIEDASQSHGSTLVKVQSGSMGDLGVFSFYPTKNLGGYGDGGMVVTKDADLARRVRLLRMYGMTDKDHTIMNGVNSRLDELQAAVLRVKLKYLDDMNAKRNEVARRYHQTLNPALFVSQRISDDAVSNYHVFAARCRAPRHQIIAHLTGCGIQTNVYYPLPLHLQQAHSALGMKRGALPVAESICDDVIALPMYAELTGEQQQQVLAAANECAEVLPGR